MSLRWHAKEVGIVCFSAQDRTAECLDMVLDTAFDRRRSNCLDEKGSVWEVLESRKLCRKA